MTFGYRSRPYQVWYALHICNFILEKLKQGDCIQFSANLSWMMIINCILRPTLLTRAMYSGLTHLNETTSIVQHPPQLYAHPSIKQLTTALKQQLGVTGTRSNKLLKILRLLQFPLLKVKLADSLITHRGKWCWRCQALVACLGLTTRITCSEWQFGQVMFIPLKWKSFRKQYAFIQIVEIS